MAALLRYWLGFTLAAGLLALTAGARHSEASDEAAADTDMSPALREWHKGPVRWLIEAREVRAYRRIRDRQAALDFIRDFWRRRDPTPDDEENPFANEFSRRLEMADLMYTEESARGSLTDRGGALILLGAPSAMRVFRRRSPAMRVPGRARPEAEGQEVEVEQWIYGFEDLRFLGEAGGGGTILTFVRHPRQTRLTKGGEILERAARAAIVAR